MAALFFRPSRSTCWVPETCRCEHELSKAQDNREGLKDGSERSEEIKNSCFQQTNESDSRQNLYGSREILTVYRAGLRTAGSKQNGGGGGS